MVIVKIETSKAPMSGTGWRWSCDLCSDELTINAVIVLSVRLQAMPLQRWDYDKWGEQTYISFRVLHLERVAIAIDRIGRHQCTKLINFSPDNVNRPESLHR
jgi:hypothetical protein